MLTTSFSSFFTVLAFATVFHPIHISVTEIEFDQENKALEIMMRVFIDDLELSIGNSLNRPGLDILQPPDGLSVDKMVEGYLAGHFSIYLDNRLQKIKYLGHEVEGDAFIFYIEVNPVKKWRSIQIRNSIITETYEDQSNLVHVSVGDEVKSLRLTRETPADQLSFNNR